MIEGFVVKSGSEAAVRRLGDLLAEYRDWRRDEAHFAARVDRVDAAKDFDKFNDLYSEMITSRYGAEVAAVKAVDLLLVGIREGANE